MIKQSINKNDAGKAIRTSINPAVAREKCGEKRVTFVIVSEARNFAGRKPGKWYSIQMNTCRTHFAGF